MIELLFDWLDDVFETFKGRLLFVLSIVLYIVIATSIVTTAGYSDDYGLTENVIASFFIAIGGTLLLLASICFIGALISWLKNGSDY